MTDGAFASDAVVRSTSDRTRRVIAGQFGPAGVMKVAFHQGMVMAVDTVELGQLAFVDFDLRLAPDSLVAEVVGESRVGAVIQGSEDPERTVRLPRADGSSRRSRPSFTSWPKPDEKAQAVGEMIRRLALCASPDSPAVVKLVAGLDVISRIDELADLPGLSDLFESQARRALEAIITDFDEFLAEYFALDDSLRQQVERRLRDTTGRLPDLPKLVDRLDTVESLASVAELVSSAPVPTIHSRGSTTGPIELHQAREGLITLVFDKSAKDHWIRVTNAVTQELVALAPVIGGPKARPKEWSAVLVLPNDDPSAQFIFHVTRDPLPEPTDPIDIHIRALRVGHKAAVADRAGDRRKAADLWNQSAGYWSRLGDQRRAELALGYAAQRISRRRYRSLVDRLLESLEPFL